jgi:hypothetical protein
VQEWEEETSKKTINKNHEENNTKAKSGSKATTHQELLHNAAQ